MTKLPLKTACEQTGIPYRTAVYHLAKGHLPVQRLGNYNIISPVSLEKALATWGYKQRVPNFATKGQ